MLGKTFVTGTTPGPPRACTAGPSGNVPQMTPAIDAETEDIQRQCQTNAYDGHQHPVLAHPEDGLGIIAVPGGALVDTEETPRLFIVFVGHQDSDSGLFGGDLAHVLLPNDAQEEGTGVVHDGDVGDLPVAVVFLQAFDDTSEEWVFGDAAHSVIGDAGGDSFAQPGVVGEKRVKTPLTAIIQINVDSAVMRENEVTDGIGAHDGIRIVVVRLEKPGIFGGNKVTRFRVCPELVLIIRMKINTRLLSLLPDLRNRVVLPSLMYYLGNVLRTRIDELRIGSGNVGRVNGISRAILKQQSDQGEDVVDQYANDDEIGQQEQYETPAHDGCKGLRNERMRSD